MTFIVRQTRFYNPHHRDINNISYYSSNLAMKGVRTMPTKELIEEVKKLEIQLHELRKENAELKEDIRVLQLDKSYLQNRLKKASSGN